MPYKDQEKQKEANRERIRRYRERRKGVTFQPVVTPEDVTPEMSYEELKESLQWGIDTGRIRPRRRVAEYYGLTQKYGPARLDKYELLELLNNDLKRKKIDAPLYFVGAPVARQSLVSAFMYSDEW